MPLQHNPIICAIDTHDLSYAEKLTDSLKDSVSVFKLGLEFFTSQGAPAVRQIANKGIPVFLDLKFHDIPNTVYGAVKAACETGVFMMTVHTSGGAAMLEAAVNARNEAKKKAGVKPLLLGVTVLTSLEQSDLDSMGISRKVGDQALKLAEIAAKSGLDGIVCSPHEITTIKKEFGSKLKLVVPGIRPAGSDKADQKRTMTPKEAVDLGADYIVIGRPITEAVKPKDAAKEILASIRA